MERDYLSVADVLGMHSTLIQRHGGAASVRDPGALESALSRQQTGYYEDVVAETAALLESLAINYPFIDGNKRIAFAAVDVCLHINHWRLSGIPMQIYDDMIRMFDTDTLDIAHIEPWLRAFAAPTG